MKVAGVFLFLISCIFSCDRKEFNEYVGNYECRKLTFNWKSGGPNEYILTENESIQVVKKKKYLVFDGFLRWFKQAPSIFVYLVNNVPAQSSEDLMFI